MGRRRAGAYSLGMGQRLGMRPRCSAQDCFAAHPLTDRAGTRQIDGACRLAWNTESRGWFHPELCSKCGFNSRRWRLRDAATLFEGLGRWWDVPRRNSAEVLSRRPAPAVRSVLEYGLRSALAAAVIRAEVEAILTEEGCRPYVEFDIGNASDDNWAVRARRATGNATANTTVVAVVYRACLNPEVLHRWLAPGDLELGRVEVDERVGGRYRVWQT